MTLAPGDILDQKYRILGILGRGGMGVVYAAENIRVRRQVAIKVMGRDAAAAGEAMLRFEREAQAAGHIGSDHIVEIFDIGSTDDGSRFMVMEMLEGETLKKRVKQGRMPFEKVSAIFRQLLDGLKAAHAAGIVHRDLKPENIFLQREKAGQRDWVKILDFGISKFSMVGEENPMTKTGTVMGTPFYMSPEQIRASHMVDHRSDLYSVAVMLFEITTGQVPFHAATYAELLFKIVYEPQPHPKSLQPWLDDEICGIILKGMDRDPARRFQNAEELSNALLAWESRMAAGSAPPAFRAPPLTLPMPPAPEPISARALPSVPGPAGLDADGAATQLWRDPNESTRSPVVTSETQKSWHDGQFPTDTPRSRKARGAVIAIAAVVLVIGAAGLFLSLQAPSDKLTEPPAPATEALATAAEPAAPAVTNAPATASAVLALPSAAPPTPAAPVAAPVAPQPSAPAPSTKAIVKPAKPPAGPTKPGGQVVTDYGY